jgi:hypothetical protein
MAALLVTLSGTPALAAPQPMDQNTTQQSSGVTNNSTDTNTSLQENTSYSHNTGIVNANNAAGSGNQQGNVTFIDSDPTFAFTGRFTQHSNGDYSNSGDFNSASVRNNALNFDTGLVSNNSAAGNLNKQVNGAVLGYGLLKSVDAAVSQGVVGGHYTSTVVHGANDARSTQNAFNNDTGEIASNIAAGDGNMQGNVLAVTAGSLNSYKISIDQKIVGGTSLYTGPGVKRGPTNTARATDQSFNNNNGDVSSNIAAGDINQQANSLTLSGAELGSYSVIANQKIKNMSIGSGRVNDATADVNAFSNNHGNVASNIAAGNGNQQFNAVHINP